MITKNRIINALAIFIMLWSMGCKDSITSGDKIVQEKFRPQFHFTPEKAWMNDPNGMVFYEGEYHLFYQYFPDSTVWGPMHWGHAVSTDLIHWEHLPIALYPDSLGYIFSGSAVVDINNTSGLGTEDNPPLIAIYTYHHIEKERAGKIDYQYQGIAFSLDKGRTWTKYAHNPVLPNPGIRDFRDPKVFWHQDTQKWIMILAVQDRIHLYSSKNLKEWSFESEFGQENGAHGGVWECPDLFKIKVNASSEEKWVMLLSINPGGPNGGSATQYFVGDFDGNTFVPDHNSVKWIDFGKDNYAGVTWSDIPETDGRRLFIGWMSNWQYGQEVPTETWRSAMTLPRNLELINAEGDYLLTSMPVAEFDTLKKDKVEINDFRFSGQKEMELKNFNLMSSEINVTLEPMEASQNGDATSFGIILENESKEVLKIGYDVLAKQFFVDRNGVDKVFKHTGYLNKAVAPYVMNKSMKLKIILDTSSIEIFVDDGQLVMTEVLFPDYPFNSFSFFSNLGSIDVKQTEFVEIESIW